MATVDSREIVDAIIKGNGFYPGDDDRVVRIVQYNNMFNGGIAYGLIYQGEDLNRYFVPQCRNAKSIWDFDQHQGNEGNVRV
jgi:hypothetical protein